MRRAPKKIHAFALEHASGSSRHSRRQLTTLDDDDWLTTRDGDMTPPKGVVTNIRGGASFHDLEAVKSGHPGFSVSSFRGERGASDQPAGIMMTVGIEQTLEK